MEVSHKMNVLKDTPDLQEDYGITQEQANAIVKSIPRDGEWVVPDWAINIVKEEMQDHARVMRCQAGDARSNLAIGQALAIDRQANKFETVFE